MNYSIFMICLAHVLCANIKQARTVPMPPDQSDIEFIVNSAYAAEQERKEFDNYFTELTETTTTARNAASDEMIRTVFKETTERTIHEQEKQRENSSEFEEYLKALFDQSNISSTEHMPTVPTVNGEVERRIVEIFRKPHDRVTTETRTTSCLNPYATDNRTALEELVERIVDVVFAKPAVNEIITETREAWIQSIVDQLLANTDDNEQASAMGKEIEEEREKGTVKRTIPTQTVTQNDLDNDEKRKNTPTLADEILKKPQNNKLPNSNIHATPESTTTTRTPWLNDASEEEKCETLNAYEHELLQLALSHARFEQRLLLTGGKLPPISVMSSADVVRAFIADRLQAPQLTSLLVQAQRLSGGSILFEMATATASLQVIAMARAYDAHRPDRPTLRVEATDADFMDIAVHSRIGS